MRQNYVTKVCKECKEDFITLETRKVFCTRSCAATHGNRLRGTKPMKKCKWEWCEIYIQDRGNQEFCSTECRRFHFRIKWINDEWIPEGEFPKWLRLDLLQDVDGCYECGWNGINPVTNRTVLQLDHVDGDPYNHKHSNIRPLCPNCHAMTPTWGNLNRGKGRKLGKIP